MARYKTRNVSPLAIDHLFKDDEDVREGHDPMANAMLSFGGASYFSPDVGDKLPSTASLFRQFRRSPRWLSIVWFKRSPYSPILAEEFEGLGHLGWRAAFEDLLVASLGRPMRSRIRSSMGSAPDCSRTTGLEWMLSLQSDGILPPLVPSWRWRKDITFEAESPVFHANCTTRDLCIFLELVDEIQRSDPASSNLAICLKSKQRLNIPEHFDTIGLLGPGGSFTGSVPRDISGQEGHPYKQRLQPFTNGESLSPAADTMSVERRSAKFQRLEPEAQTTSSTFDTVRLPDGTVKMRTVIKRQFEGGIMRTIIKRQFEDGTDDIQEKLYTYYEC